jgi:glycosyltransferase involved in cell wall biosynthesis
MRVLHIAESAQGGVGSYLSYMAPHQIETLGRGNVRLIVPEQHRGPVGPLPPGVVRTFDRPGRSPASLQTLANALDDEVRAFEPDVIHAHSTFAGLVARGMFGPQRRRPAIVYCPHGWAFNVEAAPWKMGAMAWAERLMALGCDTVIAISKHEEAEALRIGIPPDKVRLVTSGIPEAPAAIPQPWDDARLKVLFIGRLDRQKGVDVLLDAVRPLQDQVCVRVAGASVADGLAVEQLPNVEMLGWLDPARIAGQLEAADVLVAPSRWEGFGLAAVEAMRAGRPVVASGVGGLREVVADGCTGRLVEPGSVDALRRALLLDGPSTRRAMGEQGRMRYLDLFTALRMNEGVLDLYAQMCRSRRPVEDWRAAPISAAAHHGA